MTLPTLPPFGEKLRAWRKRRGFSQLDLAVEAETTPRYVSFIETGRSRPGLDVVLRIADALQLSLRDKNALLKSAGLAPVFSERPLDDNALAPILHVVDQVLVNHNPYPAIAFAPGLRILKLNATAERLFPGMTSLTPAQLIQAWCSPRPGIDNAEVLEDAWRIVSTLRHEMSTRPHPDLPDLLAQAEQLASRLGPHPAHVDDDEVVMHATVPVDGVDVKTVATVMRFDKAIDVTVAELKVELMFPADAEGARRFAAFAAHKG